MRRKWGVIETIRWRPQLPNPAIILGILPAWRTKMHLTVEAIRLGAGFLETQAPNRPLLQGRQEYRLTHPA